MFINQKKSIRMYLIKHRIALFISLMPFVSTLAQSTELMVFNTDQFGGPSEMVALNGKLYFSAYSTNQGRELWVTDGTTQGTYLLADIATGSVSSLDDQFATKAAVMNNVLYFLANDGVHGTELWRTDGTTQGTYLVRDAVSGSAGSVFQYPTVLNNVLYYLGGNGVQLWRTDGTLAGTQFIQSFQTFGDLTAYNGNLYFRASASGSFDQELWRCNGSNNVCSQVINLNNDAGPSLPINFKATSNALYFMANTQSGWELWKTQGTANTTQMVADINPGPANGVLNSFNTENTAVIGDKIFFRATDGQTGFQLWQSDGTEAGTFRISNFNFAVVTDMGLPVLNGKVLYGNHELGKWWMYDPQTGDNVESEYPARYGFIYPSSYVWIDGIEVFTKSDSVYGIEIWRADGTTGGLSLLEESDLTNNWSNAIQLSAIRLQGVLGQKIFYTQVRTHYDSRMPLRVFDVSLPYDCITPSVVVPVVTGTTSAHVVWNRPSESATYEVRHRLTGSGSWQTQAASKSYVQLPTLNANADYEVAVRANCGQGWGDWSGTVAFNTGAIGNLGHIHVVAERAEDPTTMRIYWQRTTQAVNVQFRYKPFGSATWSSFTNNTGYRRITGLQPNTLYEYQYRADGGTGWGDWPTVSFRYFLTPADVATTIDDLEQSSPKAHPNPANEFVWFDDQVLGEASLTDLAGRPFELRWLNEHVLDVRHLSAGVYVLQSGPKRTKFVVTR